MRLLDYSPLASCQPPPCQSNEQEDPVSPTEVTRKKRTSQPKGRQCESCTAEAGGADVKGDDVQGGEEVTGPSDDGKGKQNNNPVDNKAKESDDQATGAGKK